MTRHIFRMTHYLNIPTLLQDGVIYAKNYRHQNQLGISFDEINNKRGVIFRTPDGHSLHDFVPFYFSPLTVMAFTISCGNVMLKSPDGIPLKIASMREVAFFVSTAQKAASIGKPYYFTNVGCNSQSLTQNFIFCSNTLQAVASSS